MKKKIKDLVSTPKIKEIDNVDIEEINIANIQEHEIEREVEEEDNMDKICGGLKDIFGNLK